MMNYVGKTLVLSTLMLSGFFAAWAGAIYTQRLDWGWKDPRKHISGDRIPSEIDKRTALIQELLPIRDEEDRTLDGYTDEQTKQQKQRSLLSDVIGLQALLAANHHYYAEQLAALESAPGKIEIKEIAFGKNGVSLDNYLRPVWGNPVTYTDADKKTTPLDKSYARYRADLKEVQSEQNKTITQTNDWIARQKVLTEKLNGTTDEAGKEILPGLYGLLHHETVIQEKLKKERAYLQPLWVRELVNAQLLLERQEGLRARMAELKGVRAAQR
jgi:hypothetical protein